MFSALFILGLVALVAHIGNQLERHVKTRPVKPIPVEPKPPLSWPERLWSAAVHAIIIAVVIALAHPWNTWIPSSEQETTMRVISMKLHYYVAEHPELEPQNVRLKSLPEFVEMHALDQSDAAYARAYHIIFHGFDPDHADHETPVLETVSTRRFGPPRRIVCIGDGSCRSVPPAAASSIPRPR